VIPLVAALAAAYGVHLLFTAVAFGWTGFAPGPRTRRRRPPPRRAWVPAPAFDGVSAGELVGAMAVLGVLGAGVGYTIFGGVLPSVAGAALAATAPIAAARARRERRRAEARDVWPRLIEEIRIKTTTVGRSIPQALFEVGATAPTEMRPAFDAARREWLLSTDFDRAVRVLKARLADATADAVGETLLVAHALGGSQVDRCLAALAEDRVADLQGRKDADARQAGARFARRFVLVVPLGMAVLGLGVGEGRAAYGTPTGQLLVAVSIGLLAVCWWWSGRLLRLPADERVFP
jgi:tight adherence protein B